MSKRILITTTMLLVIMISNTSNSQPSISFGSGINKGTFSQFDDYEFVADIDANPVLFIKILNGRFDSHSIDSRYGFSIYTQNINTESTKGDLYDWHYYSTSFQFEYERLLFNYRHATIIYNTGFGLSFRTSKNDAYMENNCMFCKFPNTDVLLIPGIKSLSSISKNVFITSEFRYNIYFAESSTTFPYKSGIMLLFGIEISLNK